MKLHLSVVAALVMPAQFVCQAIGTAQVAESGPLAVKLPAAPIYDNNSAQTAPGAALKGISQVVASAGQYNLATSAGAVNLSRAESNELQNQIDRVRTFWIMRRIGAAERLRELGPRPTPEELARRARAAAPRALITAQIDPVSGTLFWPSVLQSGEFAEQRSAIDEHAAKWVKYGELDYADQAHVRDDVGAMFELLKSQIGAIPPQEYVTCRTFLQSVLYAITKSVL